jgi:hypothetical protein
MTAYQQIIFGVAAILLLILVLELVRRRRLREEYTVFWLFTCVVLLVVAVWNDSLTVMGRIFGTVLPLSALFGISFFLILLILLHFSTVISVLWRQNKQLAKELALLVDAVQELKKELHQETDEAH